MSLITNTKGELVYLTGSQIPVPHCFTTRLGGVSKAHLHALNLGMHRGDDPRNVEENYRILGNAVGFTTDMLVLTKQIHSDIVRKVGREDTGHGVLYEDYPPCDALITNEAGVALVVFTADCTPILLHDPVTGAVGAVHAGWRGTAAGIAAKTVTAMAEAYGCEPKNIRAVIGPNIGPCCFQTDGDVPEAMEDALGESAKPYIRQADEKFYVNLKEMNALWLRRAGVEEIDIAPHCTACQSDLFWSHRVTRGERGAQGAVIVCKGGDR